VAKLLEDILSIPECRCLEIMAGESGLKRQICWTAAIEVIDTIRFSNEGDLNFVTGLAIDSDEDFISIVMEAYRYKMAGIVFALGPYIKEIPKRVIDYGNVHDFPIFIMPWDVKISTLSHLIGEFLSTEASRNRIPIDLLKSILLGKEDAKLTPELKTQLKCLGFMENCRIRVFLLRITQKGDDREERFKELREKLIKGISSLFFNEAIAIPVDIGIAVILKDHGARKELDEKEINEIRDLAARTQAAFGDFDITIGVGNQYGKIDQIADSYNEAILITNLLSAEEQRSKGLYRYDRLGAYRLIWESGSPETMVRFSDEILGALQAYDEMNGTDFMNFLISYFKYNGSIKEISENLFLHKNTVLYKLRKLEGILNCSFTQLETLLNLRLALMVREVACNGFKPTKTV
jgi:DNA-binding PucR family transcriptional regulator